MDHETVPEFITQGRAELPLLNATSGTIELTGSTYLYLVRRVLNPMLEHINRARSIDEEELLSPFMDADIPTKSIQARKGETTEDYFDREVVEHWKLHVEPAVTDYVEAHLRSERKRTRISRKIKKKPK
ncbi:hypothetical protein [Arenivirga flava]|uniref:Uncharacterized protein n=1 Tax=Arenivirga flava TaxID=1930060 RepID=A0AA37ULF9_9MICO|nr:hypothetical protein [Arenivirga flava]GMA27156.1 hypothetical protein GCM10025874_04090 [Arenivirga flava]